MGHFGMQTASGHLRVPAESKAAYAADVEERFRVDAAQIIARYPQKRSALLPMLHLVQSVDGYITGRGIDLCAELLDLSTAEVSGVATFYTQYKRHPNGTYTVGVCTNTLCAIMGGDAIWDAVSQHLGIGHDETTADGMITLERIECNAACDFAPVVMTNWEFFDNQTPESTIALVDDLRSGKDVRPTRGPDKVVSFKDMSRVLAGFPDGRADEGVGAGPASLAGLEVARAHDWTAPSSAEAPAPAAEPAAPAAEPAAKEAAPTPASDEAASTTPDPAAEPETADEGGEPQVADVPAAPAADALAAPAADALAAPATLFAVADDEFAPGGHGPNSAKPNAAGFGPSGWLVKGNENSGLFHTPESPWYGRTKAEVWFKDAESAAAAGFTNALDRRPAKNDGKGDA